MGGRLFVFGVVGFNESRGSWANLCRAASFCLNEIGQREQVVFVAGVIGDRRSPLPQLIERVNAAQDRHHIHPDAIRFWRRAAEVNSVTAAEIVFC